MDMEAFDFFQDFPLWVDEQIFLLGGRGVIEPKSKCLDNEVQIGLMDEHDKKLFTLISLQAIKKDAIVSEIQTLQERLRDYLQQIQSETEMGDLDDEEELDFDDKKAEFSQEEKALIETPYDKPINDLVKEYLDINWLQIRCMNLASLRIGLRLNYLGDFAFTRGFKIVAVPGSNQPSKQRLSEEVGDPETGVITIDFIAN